MDGAPGAIVAVDFGSTHAAPSVFGADGPEEVEVGKSQNAYGDEGPMFLYPTAFIFPAEPPGQIPKEIPNKGTSIDLAGFHPPPDKEEVYGIKQALDVSLCEPGSQGAQMRALCANHGPVEDVLDDNLTKIFAFLWKRIEEHRQKKGYGPPEQAWITVPAAYTRGRKGNLMQERLARCAISGGFPSAIGCKSEMEAVFHYLNHLRRKAEKDKEPEDSNIEKEVLVNCGGGIVDVSAVERLGRATQLLCNSDSRPGGISDVFAQLQAKCKELRLPPGSFRLLERHIHRMTEECQDIEIGGHLFAGKSLREMIIDAYTEGFALAESVIRKIPHVTKVYIFGRPPASNELIRDVCIKRFCGLRDKMRDEGRQANFEVEILSSNIARYAALRRQGKERTLCANLSYSKAVHLGACIPFLDDAVARFREVCFGYIISAKERRRRKWVETRRFQQVKAPDSDELETYWEALQADDENPGALTIKPHTIRTEHWKPLANTRSGETHRPVAPTTYAISMETIKVDLKGQAEPNQWVWVRFKRTHPDLHPTLYTLQVDCRKRSWDTADPGEGECLEEEYELRCDSERCYFVPVKDREEEDGREDEEAVGSWMPERRRRPAGRKRRAGPVPQRPHKVRKIGPQKSVARRSTHQRKQDPYDGPSSDEEREMQAGRQKSNAHAPDENNGLLAVGGNTLLGEDQMVSMRQSSRQSISGSPNRRKPSQNGSEGDGNSSQQNTGRSGMAASPSDKQQQAGNYTSTPNSVTSTSAGPPGLRSQPGASPAPIPKTSLLRVGQTSPELRSTDAGTNSPTRQPPPRVNRHELDIGLLQSVSRPVRRSRQDTQGDQNAIRTADDAAAEQQLIEEDNQLSPTIGVVRHQTGTAPLSRGPRSVLLGISEQAEGRISSAYYVQYIIYCYEHSEFTGSSAKRFISVTGYLVSVLFETTPIPQRVNIEN
ncbi:hypothetical protein MAN_10613, partial [Metarhizium hybridum]